jgi:thiamine-phosphate pyrophosphorylase
MLGASYVTAGHIFATDCKKGLEPRGITFLENVCASVDIPVYAIGGISSDNYMEALDAGAQRVCMMSALMRI